MSISPGQITQARRQLDDRGIGVDRQVRADPRDAIAVDQQVEHAVAAVDRVDAAVRL